MHFTSHVVPDTAPCLTWGCVTTADDVRGFKHQALAVRKCCTGKLPERSEKPKLWALHQMAQKRTRHLLMPKMVRLENFSGNLASGSVMFSFVFSMSCTRSWRFALCTQQKQMVDVCHLRAGGKASGNLAVSNTRCERRPWLYSKTRVPSAPASPGTSKRGHAAAVTASKSRKRRG